MKILIVLIVLTILITGCSSNSSIYRDADNKVLCEVNTYKAYIVEPHMGDTSVVKRIPNLDYVCKK